MGKNLLNPWAIDSDGNIISIEHAHKGQEYICPKCRQQLSYCKKGNGPHSRRDHFKHKVTTNCFGYTPHESESEIHKLAKERIHDILQAAITEMKAFPIYWSCQECGIEFNGNLIQRAKSVKMEDVLQSARADVGLLDEKGNTYAAIEVVFEHDVEPKTFDFYENNNIVLIRIIVRSAEDCDHIMQKLQHPDSVNLCFNKNCKACQTSLINRGLIRVDNRTGQMVGMAVALNNPFNDETIYGLPFNEQDRQQAETIVSENWPQLNLQYKDDPFPHALFVQRQVMRKPAQYHRNPFHPTPLEKVQKNERRKAAIRANYAKKGSGSKKSGGKRRR